MFFSLYIIIGLAVQLKKPTRVNNNATAERNDNCTRNALTN